MSFDYASLLGADSGVSNSWEELYNYELSLSDNVESLLRRAVYLPHDFYSVITAYALLPSALAQNVPYLFLCGVSGSGKSSIAKIISRLHGVKINSSSDSYAGIRNDLDKRRKTIVERVVPDEPEKTYRTYGERNTMMVWDDVDASVFVNSPDIYRLFKFGSNRSSAVITISSKEIGENLEFNTFCPKVFSTIAPIHLDDRFKELRRRLIVIPCKKLEELSDERKAELSIVDNQLRSDFYDIDAYDWKGLSDVYQEFWDLDLAKYFLDVRKLLGATVRGLTSTQRAVSLDLLASGIASGVWDNETIAVSSLKAYWRWFKQETEKGSSLASLLKDYVVAEKRNAKVSGTPLAISSKQVRGIISTWSASDWLLEQPKPSQIRSAMYDLGLRLEKGVWKEN